MDHVIKAERKAQACRFRAQQTTGRRRRRYWLARAAQHEADAAAAYVEVLTGHKTPRWVVPVPVREVDRNG